LACGMPASWRGACPDECEVRNSTRRDSEAAGLHLTPLCGTFIPAQGLGVPWAPGINVRRVIHKVCWVNVPESKAEAQARSATSTVAGAGPPCQPQSDAVSITVPGQQSWRSRDSAVPAFPSPRRWNAAECWPADGFRAAETSRPRSPAPGSRTNLDLPAAPDCFLAQPAERRKADRGCGYFCATWPGEASRPFCVCICRNARARSARTGSTATVRAARGAQRRGSSGLPPGSARCLH
jgi:hypothetical protein